MRAQLLPIDGGPPIEIVKDLTLVGRKEECDLRLEHKSVSKMHCVLVKADDVLLLRDLGSTNGTRVNGQRVRRAVLLPNDQIGIAGLKFRVHFGAEPAPPVALHSEEHTQHLDAKDVANLLRQARARAEGDDSDDSSGLPPKPPQPLQRNPLPDVYPEEG